MSLLDKIKSRGKRIIGYPSKDDPKVVSSTEWIGRLKARIDVSKSLSRSTLELET
jgi:hypothetical protein